MFAKVYERERLREMRRGRKLKRNTATNQKTIVVRKKSISGKNIQLYGLDYRTAWGRISPYQKRKHPDLALASRFYPATTQGRGDRSLFNRLRSSQGTC